MQKKLLPQILMIVAVVALSGGWLLFRYESRVETRLVNGVSKSVHQFPLNLGLDLQGGVNILLEAIPTGDEPLTPEKVSGLAEVMRNRIDPDGVKEVAISKQGDRWVNIEIPGETDPDKVERLVKVADLKFIDSRGVAWEDGFRIPADAKVILKGSDLKSSTAGYDSYGRPAVHFEFKKDAADIFGTFTSRNINKYLAIALDDVIISCPTIQTAIFGGAGIITGKFTQEQVRELVTMLNAGRLPVKVKVAQKLAIGPTLGAESIRQSLLAGLLGVGAVLIFMIAYYRLPGLLADLSLIVYVFLTFGIMSLFNATLTLPGIAGFVLSIGMAVDANVIIFERVREEIKIGKTLKAAIDAGFTRAFTAILDSNVTTLIATVVLYALGTGPIRGFAVTLTIGVLCSMFSAIFVTRVFLIIAAGIKPLQSFSLYGARPANQDLAINQR
ncbi:MAG: protein translocase subunit SecD [bacterium]